MEIGTMFEVLRLKDIDINKLIGETIYVKALVSKVDIKPTRNSQEYLLATITDQTNKVGVKMWNVKEADKSALVSGNVYEMTLSVESWEGKASCIIKGYRRLDEKAYDYIEKVSNAEYYVEVIKNAINLIDHDSIYYSLVVSLVNTDIMEKMMMHPAASAHHHNIIGGLIMHTGTMLRTGYALAQVYKLDVNLVLAGIILHDIEKLNELSCSYETGEIKYTVEGSLYGHIVMACLEIDKAAALLGVEDTEEVKLLKHCVLAHHGKKEWGSPIEPAIPEALLIHYLDGLDAEMYKMNHIISHMESGTVGYEFGKVIYKQEERIEVPDTEDKEETNL